MYLGELVIEHELSESRNNALLELEHRSLPGVSERYAAVIEIYIQRTSQLPLADVQGIVIIGPVKELYGGKHDLYAVLCSLFFPYLARYPDKASFLYPVRTACAVPGSIHRLYHISSRAQMDERERTHVIYLVDARRKSYITACESLCLFKVKFFEDSSSADCFH